MKSYQKLKKYISKYIKDGVVVAFSAGVDSTLVLKATKEVADEMCQEKVFAITFSSILNPIEDKKLAKKLSKDIGVEHISLEIDEFENPEILNNPINRCYICKKYLFESLVKKAKELDCKYVFDGTNFDDTKEYRPGLKALEELGIKSPLKDLKITKKEVRKIAKELELSVSNRPSSPCMATRVPYGDKLSKELMEKIDRCERFIKSLGFEILRLRVHKNIARIEIPKEGFERFLEVSNQVISFLKREGFEYITLDLEGFRSGSMDIKIGEENGN